MDQPKITYRSGRKADCRRLAELDNIASSGAIEFLFHDLIPGMTPVDIVASQLEQGRYPYTFRNVIAAECDSRVVGMALSFPARYHAITDEMREFFPPDRLEHFRHFFSTRVEGSYYLDALSVDETFRKQGIGGKLIDLTIFKARQEGFSSLSLITFVDNTSARRLYEKKGFTVVKPVELKPHRLIPHQGGCLLLNCDIRPERPLDSAADPFLS
jgi:GNAT superfamily N-acetyltransferase